MSIARRNAHLIVEYTTAYPFRNPESDIMCVFCCESFTEGNSFRQHMQSQHSDYKTRLAFFHVGECYLKVDVTDLRCRICNESFYRLDDLAVHLNGEHYKTIDFKVDLGVVPFKMDSGRLWCGVCEYKASNLRALSRHIQRHYLQCICENCGKSYSTSTSLAHHVRYSCINSSSQKTCKKCHKAVDSIDDHFKESELCKQHICKVCGMRFGYWKMKRNHMEQEHSIPKKNYPCPECMLVYPSASSLKRHFQIAHTEEYLECGHCGKRFEAENSLNKHLVVHTGEKAFICEVCSKSFNRKSTLTQHMWIHSEVKKHVCQICDKPFNQKVCWKAHMKSHHPEVQIHV